MAAPSWLPSWPATWPDMVTLWKEYVPQEFPKYLYRKAGEAWLDLQATGEALSMVRQALEWTLKTHLPHRDTEALFLSRWEADYGISAKATTAERLTELLAKAREQGTLTLARAKDAVAPAFGTYLGSTLSAVWPDMSTLLADYLPDTAQQWAELAFQIHFFDTDENVEPDHTAFARLAARVAPAVDSWTCGKVCDCVYVDDGEEDHGYGGYDVSVYDEVS